MGITDKAINSTKWNSVYIIINTVLQLLRISVLTRFLEQSDFGLMAIALMLVSFTDIFSDLGFTVPIIHKQNITKLQYSSIFLVNSFVSVLIYALLFLFAPLVANFYNEPQLVSVIRQIGTIVIINGLGRMFNTIKIKELQYKFVSIVSIIAVSVGFIVTFILAYNSFGISSLIIGSLVQAAIREVTYFVEGIKSRIVGFYFSFNAIKDFLKIGSYQILSLIVDFLGSRIDIILIGKFLGMADLGTYNLAKELIYKCYGLLTSATRGIASSAFATLQNDFPQLKNKYNQFCEMFAVLTIVVFGFTFVFSDTICSLLYGNNYPNIGTLVRMLSLYGIFYAFTSPACSLFVSFGRTDLSLRWTCIVSAITIFTTFVFSRFGLIVVGVSQVILAIFFFILSWLLLIKPIIGFTINEFLSRYIRPLLIVGILFFPAYWITTYLSSMWIKLLFAVGYHIILLLVIFQLIPNCKSFAHKILKSIF